MAGNLSGLVDYTLATNGLPARAVLVTVAADGTWRVDVQGGALEASNTDIADEFTKLIVTQQAYSANTKVITTSNTMVQDLLNVLR